MGTQRGIGSFTSSASARKLSFRVLFWNSSSPPPWGCKDGVGPDAEEAVGSAAGNSSHKRAKEAVCLRRRAYRTKRPISGRSTFCVTTRKWLSGLMWVFSMIRTCHFPTEGATAFKLRRLQGLSQNSKTDLTKRTRADDNASNKHALS